MVTFLGGISLNCIAQLVHRRTAYYKLSHENIYHGSIELYRVHYMLCAFT